MHPQLTRDLKADGYLTRISTLVRKGHSRRSIERAVHDGSLTRVARGWVASNRAGSISATAVARGGKLTGSTALASQGVWDGLDARVHIAVRPNAHDVPLHTPEFIARLASPKHTTGPITMHWTRERYPDTAAPPWRVSTIDALLVVSRESSEEQLLACIDSAIHLGAISRSALPVLFSLLPRRRQKLLDLVDGRAESGLETLARLRLARLGHRITPQVAIPGIGRNGGDGRVDLVIDGWLAIELDGDEFHDPVVDRSRNALVVQQGYRIHRFGFVQVIHGWAAVEATVVELLRYPPRGRPGPPAGFRS
jgi:very-short-patch-repair endonuclease